MKNRPRATGDLFSDHTFLIFLRCLRSGVFRKGPGAILEAPGMVPDGILADFSVFCGAFRHDLACFAGVRRGIAGIHAQPQ